MPLVIIINYSLTLTCSHLYGRRGTSVEVEDPRRTVNTVRTAHVLSGKCSFSAEVEISKRVKKSEWKFTVLPLPCGLSFLLMLFVRDL